MTILTAIPKQDGLHFTWIPQAPIHPDRLSADLNPAQISGSWLRTLLFRISELRLLQIPGHKIKNRNFRSDIEMVSDLFYVHGRTMKIAASQHAAGTRAGNIPARFVKIAHKNKNVRFMSTNFNFAIKKIINRSINNTKVKIGRRDWQCRGLNRTNRIR